MGEICLPRCYFGEIKEKAAKIQLIGFCDSSEKAYAASVYARVTVNDETAVKLVMSKSRVAPLSKLSIPRLELLSCLILARLIIAVKETILWTCESIKECSVEQEIGQRLTKEMW